MPTEQDFTISELADLAGVTPRTVRYYVSIGLLPAPEQAGPRTRYTDGHLARLRLIRHLQRQHLPLAQILERLNGLDDEAVQAALDAAVSASPPDTALDYITRLKGQSGADRGADRGAVRDLALRRFDAAHTAPALAKAIRPGDTWDQVQAPRGRRSDDTSQLDTRTRWERVRISDDVELHIRQPMERRKHKQIERLIRLGREMLEEGE